jgi:hypothetical protein
VNQRISAGRLLLLVVLFFALSIPLAWLWREWGVQRYVAFLVAIMRKLSDTLGWPFAGKGGGGLSLRFVSHVPFLVLVFITPRLSLRRRVLGALLGSVFIAATHLFVITLMNAAFLAGERVFQRVGPFVLIMDGLPFLAWLVVARGFLRTLVPGLREEPPAGERPD